DRLIDNEAGLEMVKGLMQEVIDAATSQGLNMPPDLIERMLKHTRTMGTYLSSMQIDRREGRPLEVEAILGEPLRRARARGVSTPRLAMLYNMVRLFDPARTMSRTPDREDGHVPPP
ncbi:MAG TPA: ketopantoate reductase C-terminal domain-containing protein, partial [Tepidisphaeraceae bacterium]|nr:ketopantoate reductase C-terminal domain-containing protein [Tepidisphaeraceae bacterium]